MTKLGIWFVFFSWIFWYLANFRVFPRKKTCVQTHSIKQEWAYPLPTLCENFFLRMGLRNCASMAGFPKMEVNFHNFFEDFIHVWAGYGLKVYANHTKPYLRLLYIIGQGDIPNEGAPWGWQSAGVSHFGGIFYIFCINKKNLPW